MNRIRDYTIEEIRYGIARCKARLAGIMPMGTLDRKTVEDALGQYRDEMRRRGISKVQELF
ncbi:MAG: hypothetical protein LBC40_04165 [Dysgonamonadaceae bacterium]|jgi:hypothetical protein|nr:hypothetical protein [Dysgonamonadaceae bacterium]